jgi:hypothetical protein
MHGMSGVLEGDDIGLRMRLERRRVPGCAGKGELILGTNTSSLPICGGNGLHKVEKLCDARRLVQGYVDHYNNVRLDSATGYITPKNILAGRHQEIHTERDRNPEAARKQRQTRPHDE